MIDDEIDGQISLFNFIPKYNGLVRERCIHDSNASCNIFHAHDVARELGIECEYGCCKTCQHKAECGAACKNRHD